MEKCTKLFFSSYLNYRIGQIFIFGKAVFKILSVETHQMVMNIEAICVFLQINTMIINLIV